MTEDTDVVEDTIKDVYENVIADIYDFYCPLCGDTVPSLTASNNRSSFHVCRDCVEERATEVDASDWSVRVDDVWVGLQLTEEEETRISIQLA